MANLIADDIRDLLSLLDQALEMTHVIRERRREPTSCHQTSIVFTDATEEVPDPIYQLPVCLSRARGAAGELFERLSARPISRYVMGYLLSREEFYLLAIRGTWVKTPWGDAYEVFRMFHYEDSEHKGYINQDGFAYGVLAEEVSWERLRSEQREFFDRHLPEVAARFKREA